MLTVSTIAPPAPSSSSLSSSAAVAAVTEGECVADTTCLTVSSSSPSSCLTADAFSASITSTSQHTQSQTADHRTTSVTRDHYQLCREQDNFTVCFNIINITGLCLIRRQLCHEIRQHLAGNHVIVTGSVHSLSHKMTAPSRKSPV